MPGPGTHQGAVGDIHPDYLQPLTKTFTFRLPQPMYAAIQARSMATGLDSARVVRDLIRAGATQMGMDVITFG
jgi:hypothetical protein